MRGKSNIIKRNIEKVWGARYTLGTRYLQKNMVSCFTLKDTEKADPQIPEPESCNVTDVWRDSMLNLHLQNLVNVVCVNFIYFDSNMNIY
jgi:hypothetical protein